MPSQQGITLILSILILTVVLGIGLFITDLVLRQGKTTQEVGFSEIAYYAAEAGTEKALYEINKNKQEDKDSLEAWQGLLSTSGGSWEVKEIKKNDRIPEDDPNHFPENPGEVINSSNPLKVKLSDTESFQLGLDLKVVNYPNGLNFDWTENSAIIIYSWLKEGGGETFNTITTSPYDLIIENDRYYIARINNLSGGDITYTLTPNAGTLPIGVLVSVSGHYKDLTRQIETDNARWQIY